MTEIARLVAFVVAVQIFSAVFSEQLRPFHNAGFRAGLWVCDHMDWYECPHEIASRSGSV